MPIPDYTDILREHFEHPRNVGEIPDADGVGAVGDPTCGDSMKVWIKVEDNHITHITFKCQGCPAAIATGSIMTEMVKGMHIDDAYRVTDEVIVDALGGLPDDKQHCSNLGATGLYRAIMNWVVRP